MTVCALSFIKTPENYCCLNKLRREDFDACKNQPNTLRYRIDKNEGEQRVKNKLYKS